MNLFRYWLPVIAWMVLIFSASGDARSVQHSDSLLGQLLAWLHISVTPSQLESLRFLARKCAHMTEYAILALLWWRAVRGGRVERRWSRKMAAIIIGICALYAATDEFHQSFVKDRTPSFYDVMLDTAGASIAMFAIGLYARLRAPRIPSVPAAT